VGSRSLGEKAGRGLFASTYIKAGTFLGEYVGVLVSRETYMRLYYDCEYVMEGSDGYYVFGVDARTVLHLSNGPFMNDPL
jgi:hypothetical protein